MQKFYYSFISVMIFFTIFITILSGENSANIKIESKCYWPTPSFTGISSKFGYRKSPTKGASTYHKGIDILANQGSFIHSIESGIVKFSGFDKYRRLHGYNFTFG